MKETDAHDVERLERMLEQVTAVEDWRSHLAERDEYVELRAAWLAFGRLLEAAEGAEVDDRVGCVQRADVRDALPPGRLARATHRFGEPCSTHPIRRYFAVAAAACLALAIGWLMHRGVQPANRNLPVVRSVENRPLAPEPTTKTVSPPAVAQAKQPSASQKPPVWDDTIEKQITAVSRQIDAVAQTWKHRVDDVDLVQYRIDELSAGMANDGL